VIVLVEGTGRRVSVLEADDLKALSVRLEGCDADDADQILGALGDVDGEHVWLDIAGLISLSPRAGDDAWRADFDATMDYARSKGWVDAAGERVRAHLA
jgi:hypothetical protein